MKLAGYAGYILYINLTTGDIKKEALPASWTEALIGGWGINHKLAIDLVPAHTDPYGPDNAIIIGTGPFNGTPVPGSSQVMVTCKRSLTGGFVTSCGGGSFSLMLKSCGYDFVVISGKSSRPIYLKIDDHRVDFVEAFDLWHRADNWETIDCLEKRHSPCSVIPIGPAGENLVDISVSFVGKGGGTVGQPGLPAVMGSKNLKAIVACQGNFGVEVHDVHRLYRAIDSIMNDVSSYKNRPKLIQGGTYSMAGVWHSTLGRTIDNWTKIENPYGFPGQAIDEIHSKTRKAIACPSCPMADKEVCKVETGDFSPVTAFMTEFIHHPAFGGKTTDDDHSRGVVYVDRLDRAGLDRVNFENTYNFLVYLYQNKIINDSDTDGFAFDNRFETILKAIELTSKRIGIGDLIADGALAAAKKIGKETEDLVCHIKGAAPFVDPRMDTLNTMSFSQLVTSGRPFYAPGGIGIYIQGRPKEEFIKHCKRIGLDDQDLTRLFTDETYSVGRLAKWAHDWYSLFNCLGQCHRLYINRFHSMRGFQEMYGAITGLDRTAEDLLRAGERAWNLLQILNSREGFSRKDDQPPKIWFQPLPNINGPEVYQMTDYQKTKVISLEDVNQFLDEYYDERGWDKESGNPKTTKLKELDII
ncbi:MAG: aldehyde ferredoxin oxidoreductase C-terminal domain-containing protein [Bacillota bacterium]